MKWRRGEMSERLLNKSYHHDIIVMQRYNSDEILILRQININPIKLWLPFLPCHIVLPESETPHMKQYNLSSPYNNTLLT